MLDIFLVIFLFFATLIILFVFAKLLLDGIKAITENDD